MRVLREGHRRVGHTLQLGQVEHLQPVAAGFGDDERVVGMDLDIAPQG